MHQKQMNAIHIEDECETNNNLKINLTAKMDYN